MKSNPLKSLVRFRYDCRYRIFLQDVNESYFNKLLFVNVFVNGGVCVRVFLIVLNKSVCFAMAMEQDECIFCFAFSGPCVVLCGSFA